MKLLSYLWAQMWPNIFAPGFWTVLGISISHFKLRKHVNAKHDELVAHVTKGSAMTTVSAQGEDRSDYQPVEPWGKGLTFGFAKATEGTGWTGATFPGNWKNLKAEGKLRGAYHFLHPGEDPIAQAQHFMAEIAAAGGLEPGDMLAVDSELLAGITIGKGATLFSSRASVAPSRADVAATPAQVDACTKAFLDEVVKLAGPQQPILVYTMHAVGEFLHETAKAYPVLWFAWPASTPPSAALIAPFSAWKIWQFGEDSQGDLDAYNGTAAEMKAWVQGFITPPPPKKKVIKSVKTDGKTSLRQLASKTGDSPAGILWMTIKRVPWQKHLMSYIARANWNAVLPAGIILFVRVSG